MLGSAMAMTATTAHSYLSESDVIAHVRILEVEASATEAVVEALVLQLLSAKSSLVADSNLRFRLDLVTRGDEPEGDCYMYRSDLAEDALLEVYLSESPGSGVPYRARYVHPLDSLPEGAQYLAGLEEIAIAEPAPRAHRSVWARLLGWLRQLSSRTG